jgi:glycosyltransferase involved in cell wall biosynthesis
MRFLLLPTPREYFSPVSGGAVTTVIYAIACELLAENHDVTIAGRVDSNPRYALDAEFLSLGTISWPTSVWTTARWKVSVAHNRLRGWHWPQYGRYLRYLSRELARHSTAFDVVVANNDPLVIPFIRRLTPSLPVVLWLHNEVRPLSARLDSARPDYVVTVSDFLRSRMSTSFDLPAERIVTIHNGVDSRLFCPRQDFDSPRVPVRVLCLGRLDESKGADVAVEAVRRLRGEGLPVELDVVGSPWFYSVSGQGQDSWAKQLLINLAEVGGRHLPHAPRASVPGLVRAHDIVCVLSRWDDPFALTILEAMASGCAVVASRRGGIPEAAGDAAALVNPEDIDSVVATLRRFIVDSDYLATSKRRGLQRAKECSWAAAAAEFLQLLEPLRHGAAIEPEAT